MLCLKDIFMLLLMLESEQVKHLSLSKLKNERLHLKLVYISNHYNRKQKNMQPAFNTPTVAITTALI